MRRLSFLNGKKIAFTCNFTLDKGIPAVYTCPAHLLGAHYGRVAQW